MSAPLRPTTLAELSEAVRSASRVIPLGGGTKPRLSAVAGAVGISTAQLREVVDYDPSEFTFTAQGGTPLREIGAILAGRGQHLPFGLTLARAGATLGGTIAAGLSGPGRQRFGGVRDFILGVRFVDGTGRLLRMGGRVVKNAAGFDLPKFFVGSLGRFGILGEVTFKVFPKPKSALTLEFALDPAALASFFSAAARGRWEFEALDASFPDGRVFGRLGGSPEALSALAAEVCRRWPARILSPEAAAGVWQTADELNWAHPDGLLCKLPLTLGRLPEFTALMHGLPGSRGWIGAAGNNGFLSIAESAQVGALDRQLSVLGWNALTLRGDGPLWLGASPRWQVLAAVKSGLDPQNRFPPLH